MRILSAHAVLGPSLTALILSLGAVGVPQASGQQTIAPEGLPAAAGEPAVDRDSTAEPAPPNEDRDRVSGPLDGRQGRELLLRNFRPQPRLRVPAERPSAAAMPVVDVHTHLFFRLRHNRQALDDFVSLMDRNQIAVCVSLDGTLGGSLEEHLQFLWTDHRDRFVVFAHIDWRGEGRPDDPATWACNQEGFVRHVVEQLKAARQQGVSGLKIFKRLGLEYRDAQGELLRIDDPRWDPIWQACGVLGMPVLMHTADPSAFFEPIGPENERWEELSRRPEWSFHGDEFPSRDALLAARNRIIARHPETTFIAAHLGNDGEDLSQVARWLDTYPNLYVEPASRINELGRQPYTARDFLIRYADRVLFGTDGPWPEERVRLYWRFLETFDEHFPYAENEFPPQGFWRIYGVGLPEEVLVQIYHANAARLIPGVAERLEK